MASTGRRFVWWDRDIDYAGRAIRPDVRAAGHEIWELACLRTEAILGDRAPAAELMENAVMQVSRYLDRIEAPLSSRKQRLLMVAFSRALRRHAARLNRLEFVGGSDELSARLTVDVWTAQLDARLDLENIVRKLSQRNSAVLMLRTAGFEWKEIASMLDSSVAAVRNSFWREIARLRANSGQRPDA